MAARNVSYNGNNLQTSYIFVTDIDDSSTPTRDLSLYRLGHANGSKIPYDQYSSKTITLTGTLYGDTVTDLDSRIDTFKSYFNGVDKNLDIDYNNSTRRYVATMQAVSIDRPGGLAYAGFKVSFVCTQPFGADATLTVLCDYRQRQLISNPTFGTSITGSLTPWTAYNGATLSRPNFTGRGDPGGSGGSSMQIATTGTGVNAIQGAQYGTIATTAANTYTFSAYVKGTAGESVRIWANDTGGDTISSAVIGATGVWQRLSVTKTAATTTMSLFVASENANTAVRTTNWDDTLFEVASSPSTYFDATTRVSNSYTDTFTFDGSAPYQYPIITITYLAVTGSGIISVSNNTTGQQIIVNRTMVANDVMVIDSFNKYVLVNGVEVDFAGAFPEFTVGSGTLGYTDALTTRTMQYNVSYYRRFL